LPSDNYCGLGTSCHAIVALVVPWPGTTLNSITDEGSLLLTKPLGSIVIIRLSSRSQRNWYQTLVSKTFICHSFDVSIVTIGLLQSYVLILIVPSTSDRLGVFNSRRNNEIRFMDPDKSGSDGNGTEWNCHAATAPLMMNARKRKHRQIQNFCLAVRMCPGSRFHNDCSE
jgi:hypothetical protein